MTAIFQVQRGNTYKQTETSPLLPAVASICFLIGHELHFLTNILAQGETLKGTMDINKALGRHCAMPLSGCLRTKQ